MTPRARTIFMLIAFVDCLAVMLVGSWLSVQHDTAANVVGFVLAKTALWFGLWYFVVAPHRWRTVKRLTVTDEADLRWRTGETEYEWEPMSAKDGGHAPSQGDGDE